MACTARDRGATIHRRTCREIRTLVDHRPAQMARARWTGGPSTSEVRFDLVGRDRRGLAAAVSSLLAGLRLDVRAIELHAEADGGASGFALVHLDPLTDPELVARKLRTVEGIRSAVVRRGRLG